MKKTCYLACIKRCKNFAKKITSLHDDKTWEYVVMIWNYISKNWLDALLLFVDDKGGEVMMTIMHGLIYWKFNYVWFYVSCTHNYFLNKFSLTWIQEFYQYSILIGGVCLNSGSLFKLRHQLVIIIKKGEIIESRILMMKPIDSVYDLICILSDVGSFD